MRDFLLFLVYFMGDVVVLFDVYAANYAAHQIMAN